MHHGYRPLSLLSRADAPRDSRGKYSTCHTFSLSPFCSLPLSPSTPFPLLLLLVGVCLCCGFGLIPFVTLSPSKSQNIVVRLSVGPFPALCFRFSGWQLFVKSVSSSLWSPVDFVAILRQGLSVFSSDFLSFPRVFCLAVVGQVISFLFLWSLFNVLYLISFSSALLSLWVLRLSLLSRCWSSC